MCALLTLSLSLSLSHTHTHTLYPLQERVFDVLAYALTCACVCVCVCAGGRQGAMGAFDSDRQLGFDTSIFTAMPPPVLYVTLGERMRRVCKRIYLHCHAASCTVRNAR